MFERIIVSEELYPTRKAAEDGHLNAMILLADHVVRGMHTKQCAETAFKIINAIFDHEEFTNELPRAWGVFLTCSRAQQLLYREGKSSLRDSIQHSCDYLRWMVEAIVSAPSWMWDFALLEYGIDWIRENEPFLWAEPTS